MSEQLARLFHETYERLAPSFGYVTRKDSAVPWEQVPDRNKRLMIAVADIIELEYFAPSGHPAKQLAGELPSEFFAESGYGHNTRKPFVSLSYNGRKLAQMPPETAIELAHNLLAIAEASLGDAYLITFLRDRVGLDLREVAGMLFEFRAWREKREEGGK